MDNNLLRPQPLNSLIHSIQQQPNPFLANQLKHLLLTRITNQPHHPPPTQIPHQFLHTLHHLNHLFLNLRDQNRQQYEHYAQLVAAVNPLERLSPTAQKLFQLPVMAAAPPSFKYAILSKINAPSPDTSQIQCFITSKLKQNPTHYQSFCQQLKHIEIDEQTNYPLKDIIGFIVEEKPPPASVVQLLTHPAQSLGRTLIIKHQQTHEQINGQIAQVTVQLPTITLQLQNHSRTTTVQLHLLHNYISHVRTQRRVESSFDIELSSLLARAHPSASMKCELATYSDNLTQTSDLPTGEYSLTATASYKGMYLLEVAQVASEPSKQYVFEIDLEDKLFAGKVSYRQAGQSKVFSLKQFVSAYRMFKREQVVFEYCSQESSQRSITIVRDTHQQVDTLQVVQQINRSKAELADSFLNSRKPLFNHLITLVFQNQLNFHNSPLPAQIEPQLEQICKLGRQIKVELSALEVLQEAMACANFKMITNKPESYSTSQTLALLTEAEQALATLKDKDVIFFYGNTGSGKSTSVDYLMGLTLQYTTNRYGDNIVEVSKDNINSQQQLQQQEHQQQEYAKIGHSSCVSETRYTKGYPILASQKYKSIALADNPGFNDTRGTSFEVCTHYSMERAIDVCNRLRAIVLVVAYETITQDRASNLVKVVLDLNERFPQLLDTAGPVYPYFRILITKQPTTISQATISERFQGFARQEADFLKDNNRPEHFSSARSRVFKTLAQMATESKVHLIDIESKKGKNSLLKAFLQDQKNKGLLPQNIYQSAMKHSSMFKRFTDQISSSAQTWTKLILTPYLRTIPNTKNSHQRTVSELKQKISNNNATIAQLRKRIAQNEGAFQQNLKDLPREQSELARLQRREINPNQLSDFKAQFDKSLIQLPNYKQRLTFLQKFRTIVQALVAQSQKKLLALEHKWQKLTDLVKAEEANIASFSSSIKTLSQTQESELITKRKYEIGERVEHAEDSYTEEQHLTYFPHKFRKTAQRTTTTGRQHISICSTIVLPRERLYKLKYPEQFDPHKLIKKAESGWFVKNSELYATLQATNTKLYAFQFKKSDRQIFMGIVQNFQITEDESQLPFLRIVLKIPGYIHNRKEILNLYSCIRICQQEIIAKSPEIEAVRREAKFLQVELASSQFLLNKILTQIADHEKENAAFRQKILGQLENQDRENQIKTLILTKKEFVNTLQAQVESLGSVLKTDKELLAIKIEETSNFEDQCRRNLTSFEREDNKHKRLAFLIQSQLKKFIPDSLQYFSTFTLGKLKSQQPGQNTSSSQSFAAQSFNEYLGLYQRVKKDLKGIVENHLSENKFDYQLAFD